MFNTQFGAFEMDNRKAMHFVSDCLIYIPIVPKLISCLLASVERYLNCAVGCAEVTVILKNIPFLVGHASYRMSSLQNCLQFTFCFCTFILNNIPLAKGNLNTTVFGYR